MTALCVCIGRGGFFRFVDGLLCVAGLGSELLLRVCMVAPAVAAFVQKHTLQCHTHVQSCVPQVVWLCAVVGSMVAPSSLVGCTEVPHEHFVASMLGSVLRHGATVETLEVQRRDSPKGENNLT